MHDLIPTVTITNVPQPVVAAGKPISTAHNNNFNFLRLLFASLVLVSHAPEIADGNRSRELLTRAFGSLSFGELAVDCFFLLSGYLIVSSWERRPELKDFFSKRIQRIYPGYLVALLVCVLVVGPIAAPSAATYFAQFSWYHLLGTALKLRAPTSPTVFAGTHYPVLNGAMWSISFEFRCYALAALTGLVGAKWQKGIWLTLLVSTFVLAYLPSWLGKLHFPGMDFLLENPVTFVRTLTFFSSGACFYLFRKQLPLKGIVASIALVLLVLMLFDQDLSSFAVATVGAYILFWFAFTHVPALDWFQRKDDISYGLYLYGWPVQKLLFMAFPGASPWQLLLPALLLSGLMGYLSWNLVEIHFLKRTRKKQVAI